MRGRDRLYSQRYQYSRRYRRASPPWSKGRKRINSIHLIQTLCSIDQISENETIKEDEFVGPLKGKSISDLTTTMGNGSIYANIHTQENPNGEIRGQVMSSK